MRMLLFSLLVLQCFLGNICGTETDYKIREITLIRRAYIDVLGIIPTIDEIDWYMVYSTNGYQTAVEYLLMRKDKQWNIDNTLGRALLYSSEYAKAAPRKLTQRELDVCVMYIAGELNTKPVNQQSVSNALDKILSISQDVSTDPLDRIDYICNLLMSRSTNVNEANELLHLFRISSQKQNEDSAWHVIIEHILKMPDVCHK